MSANEGPAPQPTGSGPSENSAATKPLSLNLNCSRWARQLIAAGGPDAPQYGSPEWERLDDHDPVKVAAAVRAAEAWRTYWSPEEHVRRARLELDAAREDDDDQPAQWGPEVVAAVRRSAMRLARGESYAGLCDRRGEPERAARAREHEQRMDRLIGIRR